MTRANALGQGKGAVRVGPDDHHLRPRHLAPPADGHPTDGAHSSAREDILDLGPGHRGGDTHRGEAFAVSCGGLPGDEVAGGDIRRREKGD